MHKIAPYLALLLLFFSPSFNFLNGQTAPEAKSSSTHFKVCDETKVDPATHLDECQMLFVQKIYADAVPVQEAMQRINDRLGAFIQGVQSANAGMHYEQPSQQFPTGRLVKNEPQTAAAPSKDSPTKPNPSSSTAAAPSPLTQR